MKRYTASEAAERLRRSKAVGGGYIREGRLAAVKVPSPVGRDRYLIKEIDLLNFEYPKRGRKAREGHVPKKEAKASYTPSDFPTPMILTRDGEFLSYTVKEANDRGIDWVEAGTLEFVPEFKRRSRVVEVTEIVDMHGDVISKEEAETV